MPKMRLGWYAGVSFPSPALWSFRARSPASRWHSTDDGIQVSTALAGSVVLSAFNQRPNFYSAMVHLSQSNFCLLVRMGFRMSRGAC